MFWLLFTFQSRSDTPTTKNKKIAFRWDGLKLGSTWRIIPFSKLLTMASTVSPLDLGKNSPSKWPFHSWLKIHGGGGDPNQRSLRVRPSWDPILLPARDPC